MHCLILAALAVSILSAQEKRVETISLEDVILRMLEQHPEVEVQRAAVAQTRALANGEREAFDPVFRIETNFKNGTSPVSSVLEAPNGRLKERLRTQAAQIDWLLPFSGINLSSRFENQKTSSSNPYYSLSPYFTPQWNFQMTVPLLRGRHIDEARYNLHVRWKQVGIAREEAQIQLSSLIKEAESAHHELADALRALEAAELYRNTARRILSSTQRLIAAGELAPAEESSAYADLILAEESVAQVQQRVNDARLQLSLAVGTDPATAPAWRAVSNEAPSPSGDAEKLIADALRARPEFALLEQKRELAHWEGDLGRDMKLPRVDVKSGVSLQGLAGDPVAVSDIGGSPRPLQSARGGFPQALKQLPDYPTWQIGLSINFPLHSRQAEAHIQHAAQEKKKLAATHRELQERVTAEVMAALHAVQSAKLRTVQTQQAQEQVRTRMESELRRFHAGEVRLIDVETRARDLQRTDQIHSAALRSLDDAETALRHATGETLTAWGIALTFP